MTASGPTRKLLLLFILVTIALVTFGVFLQQGQRQNDENTAQIAETSERIEQERAAVLDVACKNDLLIQNRYNSLLDALIEIDKQITLDPNNEPLNAAVLQARIAAYEAGKIDPLPVCEPTTP